MARWRKGLAVLAVLMKLWVNIPTDGPCAVIPSVVALGVGCEAGAREQAIDKDDRVSVVAVSVLDNLGLRPCLLSQTICREIVLSQADPALHR